MVPAIITTTKAIQPKPSKAEILEALVQLRVQEIILENELNEKKRAAIDKKLNPAVLKYMKSNWDKLATIKDYGSPNTKWENNERTPTGKWSGTEVRLEIKDAELPAELKALLTERRDIPCETPCTGEYWVKQIRNELRDKMNSKDSTSHRVKALVNHPASRKALTSMLATLTSTATESVAIEA